MVSIVKSHDPEEDRSEQFLDGHDQVHVRRADWRLAGRGRCSGGVFPVDAVAAAWSEPPFATIGLGTGTMASYGRPFQHVHYYEIDRQIRRLSLPENRVANV